jgi:hypothetical protein
MKQAGLNVSHSGEAVVVPFPDELGVGTWVFVENAAALPWRS